MKKKQTKKTLPVIVEKETLPAIPQDSAERLISQAITNKVPVETLERLLVMRNQLKAEKAKEDFDTDMAGFQAACPTIKKTKEGARTNRGNVAYYYAPLEDIVSQVKSILAQFNFSYAIETTTEEKDVSATCIVKHIAGHSERSTFRVPISDKTQMMSAAQGVASVLTFAKRYAFCNAFGILTGDADTDAQPERSGDVNDVERAQNETRSAAPQHTEEKEFDPVTSTIGFGKHGGKTWAEIPVDYLQWMSNAEKTDKATKEKALATLKYLESVKKQVPPPAAPLDEIFGRQSLHAPVDVPAVFKDIPQATLKATLIEILEDSLNIAARNGSLESLNGWYKINTADIEKLSETDKAGLRKAYEAAKKLLGGK